MAEREPSSTDNDKNLHNDHDHVDGPDHDHGPLAPLPTGDQEHVLVVQIPKDQIYRVPPPENALIIERHRNPLKKADRKKLCGCFSWCSCICISVVILVLLAILIMIRLLPSSMAVIMLPQVPVFRVEHFSAKNLTHPAHHHPEIKSNLEYDITMKDENGNPLTGILYQKGGHVYLSCKGKEIASGNYPTFDQRGKETNDVKLTLQGLDVHLPEDIDKSMKSRTSKVHVPFSLEMDVPAGMKIGILKSGTMKFVVSCSFVVDTLDEKVAHILSQECNTKRTRL